MLFCPTKHWAGSVLFAVSLVHAPAFTLGRTRPAFGRSRIYLQGQGVDSQR